MSKTQKCIDCNMPVGRPHRNMLGEPFHSSDGGCMNALKKAVREAQRAAKDTNKLADQWYNETRHYRFVLKNMHRVICDHPDVEDSADSPMTGLVITLHDAVREYGKAFSKGEGVPESWHSRWSSHVEDEEAAEEDYNE